MPQHKSSVKRMRSDAAKRTRNSNYMSSVRTAVKKFRTALSTFTASGKGDTKQLTELLTAAQSRLHKAAQKGIIHKNNAVRSVSRLAQSLNLATGADKKATSKKK